MNSYNHKGKNNPSQTCNQIAYDNKSSNNINRRNYNNNKIRRDLNNCHN